MKIFTMATLFLLIVGGVNWGLVGLFNFDLVATIFGAVIGDSLSCLYLGRALSALAARFTGQSGEVGLIARQR